MASALKRARTFAMDPRSAPWYYLHVEAYQKGVVEQQGPIPFDELHVMYKDGKVERDTFVWSECHEADDFFQIESVPELVAALEVPLEGDAAKAEDPTTSVTQPLPEDPPKDETRPPESAADTEANTTTEETSPSSGSAPEQTTTIPIASAPSHTPSSMRTPGRSGSGALEAIMRRVGGSTAKCVASAPRVARKIKTSRSSDNDEPPTTPPTTRPPPTTTWKPRSCSVARSGSPTSRTRSTWSTPRSNARCTRTTSLTCASSRRVWNPSRLA